MSEESKGSAPQNGKIRIGESRAIDSFGVGKPTPTEVVTAKDAKDGAILPDTVAGPGGAPADYDG